MQHCGFFCKKAARDGEFGCLQGAATETIAQLVRLGEEVVAG